MSSIRTAASQACQAAVVGSSAQEDVVCYWRGASCTNMVTLPHPCSIRPGPLAPLLSAPVQRCAGGPGCCCAPQTLHPKP